VRRARYFSPRLLCRFDLAVSANSISPRIASDRVVLLLLGPGFKKLGKFSWTLSVSFPRDDAS
jgi:hypothetical protein